MYILSAADSQLPLPGFGQFDDESQVGYWTGLLGEWCHDHILSGQVGFGIYSYVDCHCDRIVQPPRAAMNALRS